MSNYSAIQNIHFEKMPTLGTGRAKEILPISFVSAETR